MITGGGGGGITFGNGGGQVQRARTVSTVIPADSAQHILTLNWPSSWADTNYTVVWDAVDEDGLGFIQVSSAPSGAPTGSALLTKTAAHITVGVFNLDGVNPHNCHIEAMAIHD